MQCCLAEPDEMTAPVYVDVKERIKKINYMGKNKSTKEVDNFEFYKRLFSYHPLTLHCNLQSSNHVQCILFVFDPVKEKK